MSFRDFIYVSINVFQALQMPAFKTLQYAETDVENRNELHQKSVALKRIFLHSACLQLGKVPASRRKTGVRRCWWRAVAVLVVCGGG